MSAVEISTVQTDDRPPAAQANTPLRHARPSAAVSGQAAPWFRVTVLLVVGLVFLIPVIAMLEYTLRGKAGGYSLEHWSGLFAPENPRLYRNLGKGIGNSLLLMLLTIGYVWLLFLPTIVLVQLKFRKLARAFELLTVLPIAVPAIVLVVGLAPLYRLIAQMTGGDVWTLSLAYGVLVLPFAYRAIVAELNGMDAATLSEAARSLGASWPTVLIKIIVPGLRRGLTSATLITAAIVLGEFTVSSLLNRVTMQVALIQVSKSDPYAAVIVSLLSLLTVFLLLFVFASLDPQRRRDRRSARAARRAEQHAQAPKKKEI